MFLLSHMCVLSIAEHNAENCSEHNDMVNGQLRIQAKWRFPSIPCIQVIDEPQDMTKEPGIQKGNNRNPDPSYAILYNRLFLQSYVG